MILPWIYLIALLHRTMELRLFLFPEILDIRLPFQQDWLIVAAMQQLLLMLICRIPELIWHDWIMATGLPGCMAKGARRQKGLNYYQLNSFILHQFTISILKFLWIQGISANDRRVLMCWMKCRKNTGLSRMVSWAGFKQCEIVYDRIVGPQNSNTPSENDQSCCGWYFLFSLMPLRIASWVGSFTAILAVVGIFMLFLVLTKTGCRDELCFYCCYVYRWSNFMV